MVIASASGLLPAFQCVYSSPIRLSMIKYVIFDAFGTIIRPKVSVFETYARVGSRFGRSIASDEVEKRFRRAFKHWRKTRPLYGKLSVPPLTHEEWWRGLIGDIFGDNEAIQNELIEYFMRGKGYALDEGFQTFLQETSVPYCVASGTDPSLRDILAHLMPDRPLPPIYTTWDVECEKTTDLFWQRVVANINSEAVPGVVTPLASRDILVVGDDYTEDFQVPQRLGFHVALLADAKQGEQQQQQQSQKSPGGRQDTQQTPGETHTRAHTIASIADITRWL